MKVTEIIIRFEDDKPKGIWKTNWQYFVTTAISLWKLVKGG